MSDDGPILTPTVLVVEDEEAIATLIQYNLEKEGFLVNLIADGEEALELIRHQQPDLVLLDWMLPGLSGIEICERLRDNPDTRGLPIIMLTARGEEDDRVRGLDAGADDYVVKPFSPGELIARIRAVLRRMRPAFSMQILEVAGITMDLSKYMARYDDQPIRLGPTEFRLLAHFLAHPRQVFTREHILDSVWGREIYVEPRTVDVHIRRLRKSLNERKQGLGDRVKTVRSAGYSFEPDAGAEEED